VVIVRTLTVADIPVAAAIARVAFGPTTATALERWLALQPGGLLIAEIDGEPAGIGSITGWRPYAVVGLMATRPEMRRRGVASAILGRLLTLAADWGCELIGLDATADGAPLYRSFGFREVDSTVELRRKSREQRGPQDGVRPIGSADIDLVDRLDSTAVGCSRRRLFEQLLGDGAASGWLVPGAGYLFRSGARVGPAVALTQEAARSLLEVAIGAAAGDLVMATPAANESVIELAKHAGFEPARSLCHMRRGPEGPFGDRNALMALASYGLG
jgi:GNAT superfamily N-acetyltransferase